MKKRLFLCAAFFGAAFLLCAADRGGGRGGSIVRMHQVSMPQPHRFERPESVVDDSLRVVEPKHFEGGEAIKQPRETRPPAQHSEVTRNEEFGRNILREQGAETLRGHFYWHNTGGVRYAHYYDAHGVHWYGFYHGPKFYWCRYSDNFWWWYDAGFSRWVYWWGGYWWWWGPGGIAYVYTDNSYYPYDMTAGGVVVKKPETVSAPKTPPAPEAGQGQISPDKSRLVQIYGANSEAFLYDNTGPKPVYLAYLGHDVAKVRFSQGAPAQILVDFKDGDYALYSLDGKSQEAAQAEPPKAAQPPAPESVPPAPTSAPGQ